LRNYPTHNTTREFTNTTVNYNKNHQGRILIFPRLSCQAQFAKITPCSSSSVENLYSFLKKSIENSSSLCIFLSRKGFPQIFEKLCWKLFWLKYKRGGELDFKTFWNNLIFFSKMQFCFTDWIFIWIYWIRTVAWNSKQNQESIQNPV